MAAGGVGGYRFEASWGPRSCGSPGGGGSGRRLGADSSVVHTRGQGGHGEGRRRQERREPWRGRGSRRGAQEAIPQEARVEGVAVRRQVKLQGIGRAELPLALGAHIAPFWGDKNNAGFKVNQIK